MLARPTKTKLGPEMTVATALLVEIQGGQTSMDDESVIDSAR
jgi:hypothetical protein